MSKTLALDFGYVLRTTSALVALGFFPAALPAQQVLAGGANLFAPSPHVGRELGVARALPVASSYATEGLKANADPGTLVRSEPATEYALPPGVTEVRILYHTRTAGNVDAVAAVVLVPYGQAPPGGWSLLAWSHGTSGVARECAPSRIKSLFYSWETLGVAQLEGTIQDPDFLGTVALAGASDLEDGLDSVLRVKIPVLNGLVAFWVYGVKTVYPELDLKDLLTSKARFTTHPLKMDAAPPVVPLRLSPQTKSSFPGGRRTNTSGSSASGINQAEERPMGLCYWLAVATTSKRIREPMGFAPALQGRCARSAKCLSGTWRRSRGIWVPARPVGLYRCSVCRRAATRQLSGATGFQLSIWPWNKRGPSTVAEG